MGYLKYLYFVVFTIILISGCVGVATGNGIKINSFSFSPNSILAGQKTILDLDIQNIGTFDADNIYVFLYGLASDWSGFEAVNGPISLMAPKTDMKIEGEPYPYSWILTSPKDLPQELPFTFTAQARLCYPYKTVARAKVEIMSENEWLNQRGQIRPHDIKMQVSRSPVTIGIKSPQPLIESSDNEMVLKLNIQNVGGGTVTTTSCEQIKAGLTELQVEKLNKVDLKISNYEGTCEFPEEDIFLRKGESKEVTAICDAGGITSGAPLQTKDLELQLDYTYYVDTDTNIRVEGYITTAKIPGVEPTVTDDEVKPTPSEEEKKEEDVTPTEEAEPEDEPKEEEKPPAEEPEEEEETPSAPAGDTTTCYTKSDCMSCLSCNDCDGVCQWCEDTGRCIGKVGTSEECTSRWETSTTFC